LWIRAFSAACGARAVRAGGLRRCCNDPRRENPATDGGPSVPRIGRAALADATLRIVEPDSVLTIGPGSLTARDVGTARAHLTLDAPVERSGPGADPLRGRVELALDFGAPAAPAEPSASTCSARRSSIPPVEQVYARALERIDVMEQTGYSVCPSVQLMGMLVAARTRRLRIGTAVTLAALAHPLRIAEEVALLDVLSGGRVNWGAGRGFERHEFEAFQVPMAESSARFREAVETCARPGRTTGSASLVSSTPSSTSSRCRSLSSAAPAELVAATSEDAVRWAASRGFDPDGPALAARRDRAEARAVPERARGGRLRLRTPRAAYGAASRDRRERGRGRGHRAARRELDAGRVHPPAGDRGLPSGRGARARPDRPCATS